MNPIPTRAYKCEFCSRTFSDEAVAENCCKCSECHTRVKEGDGYTNLHRHCFNARQQRLEQKRFKEAERVMDWDSWVFSEAITGSNDGYFATFGDFLEQIEDMIGGGEIAEADELPTHCYCTTPHHHSLDVAEVLENFCSDGWEDMDEHISGENALSIAIDRFNESNKDLISYRPDYKKIIVVDQTEFLAKLKAVPS